MSTTLSELLAASSTLHMAAAFVGGLVVAGLLVWAVRLGMGIMDREPDRPRADEQPKLPATGAVREEREMREPDEVPLAANGTPRLMPYELHHAASRRGEDQHRRRWQPGSSGAFGSGSPGRL